MTLSGFKAIVQRFDQIFIAIIIFLVLTIFLSISTAVTYVRVPRTRKVAGWRENYVLISNL